MTKKIFKAWEELSRMTGIAFNPLTNKADVAEESNERWKSFVQVMN